MIYLSCTTQETEYAKDLPFIVVMFIIMSAADRIMLILFLVSAAAVTVDTMMMEAVVHNLGFVTELMSLLDS